LFHIPCTPGSQTTAVLFRWDMGRKCVINVTEGEQFLRRINNGGLEMPGKATGEIAEGGSLLFFLSYFFFLFE
jgi:hypothetical protein